MRKVGIIAFDSHNGFPFVNLFAVTQGMNFDSFRMESALTDQSNDLVGTANNNMVTGEHLHQHARMVIITV